MTDVRGVHRTGAFFLLLTLTATSPAFAEWTTSGIPVCSFPSGQWFPLLTGDGAGGTIVVWQDDRDDPGPWTVGEVYAQRIDANGNVVTGWSTEGQPICVQPGSESAGDICPDGSGGAYVVWTHQGGGSPSGIFLSRILEDGTIAAGWPTNGLTVHLNDILPGKVVLAPDGSSGVYVAWWNSTDDSDEVLVRRFQSDATSPDGWPAGGVPVEVGGATASQVEPDLVGDGNGGVIVVWMDARNWPTTGWDLYAQRLGAGGTVDSAWPDDGTPLCRASGDQFPPRVVADGQGGFFVTWTDARAGTTNLDLFASRIQLDGSTAPGWGADGNPVCSAAGWQDEARIVASQGGALIVWEDGRPGGEDGLYVQRMLPQGSADPAFPSQGLLVCGAPGGESNLTMCTDDAGGAYIAWTDSRGNNFDVYATHILVGGTRAAAWLEDGNPVDLVPSYRQTPRLTADGKGGAIIAWTSLENRLYAQHLADDAIVSARVSLVESSTGPGLVRLAWSGTDAARVVAWVERSFGGDAFERVGVPRVEAPDRLAFEDRDVPSGSVSYRLAIDEGGTLTYSDPIEVQVPAWASSAFALFGFAPNPASGEPWIDLALPGSAPAQLELIDVTGRRIASREVGSLGSGRHRVRFDSLPAGMYWMRLDSGGRTLVQRGVVTR